MQKSAFERTGLVPRSIIRTFDRFRRQLLPGAEDLVIQEFRVSKYQVLVSVRCLASLLFFPLLVNYLVKTTILIPLAEYIWNTQQSEIFLNFYQENRAFLEMRDFEEKTFFESLVSVEPKESNYNTLHFADKMEVLHKTQNSINPIQAQHLLAKPIKGKQKQETTFFTATKEGSLCFEKKNVFFYNQKNTFSIVNEPESLTKFNFAKQNLPIAHFIEDKIASDHLNCQGNLYGQKTNFLSENKKIKNFSKINASQESNIFPEKKRKNRDILLQKKFQEKTIQLATFYNQQTISAIANVFGDFVTLITIAFLFVLMKPQIIILKSFLTESIYSLSDTTKSFLLILLTDLLVGFHSPRGWEILIEVLLRHFGLPENQDFVFLFVATLPVLLDTVFKYWIFRYLNQISPSTVATYHSMIE